MKPIPFVDLGAHHRKLAATFQRKVARLLRNSDFILGEEVAAFEQEFARYLGVRHVVGVASGTDALVLSLKAVGIGPGDEVLVPTFTFAATGFAISLAGATPRFVDVDDRYYGIDPSRLTVNSRTKAIIPVHLYGQPADMDPLLTFARKHGLYIIEDAAQAHGAFYRRRRVGAIGDVGCFSFYPSKNLGALGDGGALATNDDGLAERLRMWRNVDQIAKYEHAVVGHNSRLDSIQAAFLRVKLVTLDTRNGMRRKNAELYAKKLRDSVGVPAVRKKGTHVYHLYVIRSLQREAIRARLTAAKIPCGVYYPIPLHRQPSYPGDPGSFPVAESLSRELLAIPMFPEMTSAQIERVSETIRSAV